jgi:hypothetical protein
VGFLFSAPAMNPTNTVATFQPGAPLARQTYRLRVSGTVTNTGGVALGADVTQATGFTVTCAGKLVISQLSGGGGIAGGSPYQNDFVELHNSGGAPVDLTGYFLQSGSAAATTIAWSVQALPPAIIQPGGYFLIREQAGATPTMNDLPAPDATASPFNLNGTAGKVALMQSGTAFVGGCPLTATPAVPTIDLVGFGSLANCFEGTKVPTLGNPNAAIRNDGGCMDTGVNSADFTVAAVGVPGAVIPPRNSAYPLHVCSCPN